MASFAGYFPNRRPPHTTRQEPMSADLTHRLATKRLVIGHLTVCQGCCCGNTENGRPPVPVDWLKKEWRARGLLKRVQLTISGCLGPCDLPNVVTISNENGTQWFGEITQFEQYRDLVDWATRSRDAGELLPLPKEFQRHTLHPFRKCDSRARR
jgi:(2Fe-2S) ferredoxin